MNQLNEKLNRKLDENSKKLDSLVLRLDLANAACEKLRHSFQHLRKNKYEAWDNEEIAELMDRYLQLNEEKIRLEEKNKVLQAGRKQVEQERKLNMQLAGMSKSLEIR